MTNKEAIELLKKATMFEPTLENRDYPEAFDLAIKALEEVEEWHKLKLICANEGIVVYKIREVKKNDKKENCC